MPADIADPGFTATAPTFILNLGYTSTNAQLMTVPIYMVR